MSISFVLSVLLLSCEAHGVGSVALCSYRMAGHKPYLIPTGGSNVTGAWGYIEGFREMLDQVRIYGLRPGDGHSHLIALSLSILL